MEGVVNRCIYVVFRMFRVQCNGKRVRDVIAIHRFLSSTEKLADKINRNEKVYCALFENRQNSGSHRVNE